MCIVFVILLIACGTFSHALIPFASLAEAQKYAQSYEESVIPDNRTYLNSDYTSTYRRHMPTWWSSLLNGILSAQQPDGRLARLKEQLDKVIAQRTEAGFLNRHVICVAPEKMTMLLIWGDLRGAFHSFVRGLVHLHEQGILADDLTIRQPSCYLVLNANALGNAPWNCELLELILSLMVKNPEQVLYIKGSMEDRNVWADQGLMRQLNVLSGLSGTHFGFPAQVVEYRLIEQRLAFFFDTLPVVLYLAYGAQAVGTPYHLMRFSGSRFYTHEWNERALGDLFVQAVRKKSTIVTHDIQDKTATTASYLLRALAISMGNVIDFEPTNGLIEVGSIEGATVWSIFSGPTDMYRLTQGFFSDAFVIMRCGEMLDEATFTLFRRDVRTQEAFHAEASYFVATGVKVANAGEKSLHAEVVVGASLDLSKGLSEIGKAVRQGATARLEEEHQHLAHEKPLLKIVFLDDEASPHKAFENMLYLKKAVHTSVVCFPIAESLIQRYVQEIKKDEVLVLFPLIGSSRLRSPDMKGILFFRPSFAGEIRALLKHALANAPGRRFCFFYQDDELGVAALEEAQSLLQQESNVRLLTIPHARNATSFAVQVKEFKTHDSDALFFFSFPAATRAFIQQLGVDSLVRTDLYGISMLGDQSFKGYLASLGLSLIASHAVPNPRTSNLQVVREYRAAMDLQGFGYDPFSLEGYLTTSLLLDAMQTMTSVDKDSLVAHFSSLHGYDFKGLSLTFRPERRDFGQPVWLDTGTDEWEPYYE